MAASTMNTATVTVTAAETLNVTTSDCNTIQVRSTRPSGPATPPPAAINMAPVLKAAGDGATDSLVVLLQELEPQVPVASSEALLYAASSGRLETVRMLVSQCGADVRHVSENGWTATMFAARNGHTEAVVALVNEFSALADHETSVGRTALMYAASHGHFETVVALAEQCGADPQHGDVRGWSAIMYARAAGHDATARLLEAFHAALAVEHIVPVLAAEHIVPVFAAEHRGATEPRIASESSSHKRKECPSEALPEHMKGDTVVGKVVELNTVSSKPFKRNSGVRVLTSHLPRKVSTPPPVDQMRPGPCAEGGGLWTILESLEVGADCACGGEGL